MCLHLPEHLQSSLSEPQNRAEHRALIPPKKIKAEQELLQKLMHTFLISYCNKSLLPLRTDFLLLLLVLTGHLPPKQTSTTCLGGRMVSIYPGHSHHFQQPLNKWHQVKTLCASQEGLTAWGVGMGRSCRGAVCRAGCQLSSPFLCCCEQPKNKQSSWSPASPAAKPCLAPPSARLQLVNGL